LHQFWGTWQIETEAVEQFGHRTVGARDHAQAQLACGVAAGFAHGEDDVHAAHGGHFFEKLAGAVAQAFAAHPHLQGAPERQAQEADEEVGFDPLGFVMEDRTQAQSLP